MKYFLFIIVFILSANLVYPFGKNKVVYYPSDWQILESPHFRIYMPKDNLFLSNEILSTAEEIFAHHSTAFGYTPKVKIKIILYNNQIDFQQNNIMDWTSPGTGGFTEFLKGRVVVPYSASYPDFYHVLSHEINHAFQGYQWGKGEMNRLILRDIDVPLWLIEGASEFNSIGVDKECEMIIADGLINGILPSLQELSDLYRLGPYDYFYIYKEGQIFYQFIQEKYGRDAYSRLNASIAENKTFDQVLTNYFSKSFNQLNVEFFDYLRKKYLPGISALASIEMTAKKIMREDTVFNMNPVSLGSNRIAFISDRDIYPSIVIYDGEKDSLNRIVKGGFDEDFLEFQYGKRNNLSLSTNGLLCFVSRSGGEDSLFLYSLKKKNTEKISLPFRIINSPDISMDGSKIVFSAVQNQQADIFIYDRQTKTTTSITSDEFYDSQPRFLGTNRIVFISNRKNGIKSQNMDIFIYNLENNKFELVLDTSFSDEYPAVSKDMENIAFIKMDIHPALMIYSLKEKKLYEEIVPTGGVFSSSYDENGDILLTAYNKNRYNIFKYTPSYKKTITNFYHSSLFSQEPAEAFSPYPGVSLRPYKLELSIDALFGGFAFNTSLGAAALGMLQFSDLLGDERYQLLLDTTIILNSSFLDYLNADFTYLNLKNRHNYGIRIFQYSNYFYELNTLQEFYNMEKAYSKTYGGFILYSYPFSTFDRVEAQIGYRGFNFITNIVIDGSNISYFYDYQNRNLLSLSYVHDSTLWDITGPIDGFRYELTLSKSFSLYQNSLNYEKAVFDFRSYFMILPNLISGYSFAFRAVAGKVFDTDKNKYPFYLGGFNSIRGFDLWSFQGDNMFLCNFELRIPFIYNWTLGFPFPIRMPTIWGVFFWDFGSVWNSENTLELFETRDNATYLKDLKSGLGFGFRLVLLPAIKLMVNFATPYDGSPVPPLSAWQTFWLIGIDF